jgi:hypothetical protein
MHVIIRLVETELPFIGHLASTKTRLMANGQQLSQKHLDLATHLHLVSAR